MNDIQLSIHFMKIGAVMVVPLIVTYLVLAIVKNSLIKCIVYFLKVIAYVGLALIMWNFYKNKDTIDIISLFTFTFCCFESVDNLISLISIPIEFFRDIREKEIECEINNHHF